MIDESIGVLLPTRGRLSSLRRSLSSLNESALANKMEVIVVADHDEEAFWVAVDFLGKHNFFRYRPVLSDKRIYSVSAFNLALENCIFSEIFTWVSDKTYYDKDWLLKLSTNFYKQFPDRIGVISAGGKRNKANFGITSKKFIEYNEGEWFWDGYTINYCDDELACRAILLGRYSFLGNSGIHVDDEEVNRNLLFDTYQEKITLKKRDRTLFYDRSETNFGLSKSKIYEWNGFRNVNYELKGG